MIDPDKFWNAAAGRFASADIPALTEQYQTWKETRPLAGMRVLDGAPVFYNTCVKYAALLAAGADLTVAVSDAFPYDPAVVDFLKESGIPCLPAAECKKGQEFDIILDNGAVFCDVESTYGASELTRSGVNRYEQISGKNVFLADSGIIKRIETMLGTGESCLRTLKHLGYGPFDGKKLLLFGCGKVGRGIAMYFRRDGAIVTTVSADNAGDLHKDDTAGVKQAISQADVIVTVTGHADAAAVYAEEIIRSHAVLANMGVEDEFGANVPAERVLNGKQTLNFMLEEPTLTRYIETTLALHNAGAVILKNTPAGSGKILPPPELEHDILETVKRRGAIPQSEMDLVLKGM